MINKKRIAAVALGLALVLGGASQASAQTLAELQAQIVALMAQIAALQGGASVTTGTQFTQNLTIGSTGPEVVALQQMLVAKGYLTMPAGTAYGYFGGLTKAAVVKWQMAAGVSPASGYFGPISRAAANAAGGITTGGTTTGGTTTGGTTAGGVITTPGVEGTLTATLNSTPTGVKLHEGDTRTAVMGIKLEAKTSDIRVERVKLDLGNSTDLYRKIADKVYIMDGSTVLGSMNLNSDTVVKEGGEYFITVSGMSVIVPKDTTKVLTVALDALSNIDTADEGSYTIVVPQDGIRGVDGAGINQTTPASGTLSRSFTVEGDLSEDATLKVSLNTASPAPMQVIASAGADEDELDGLTTLKFDVKAEKDAVTITDLTATTTLTGNADATTIYLMDGNTVLGSEAGPTSAGTSAVTFDDLDYTVSKDSTRTLTIKVDVQNADTSASTIVSSVTAGGIVAENSLGDDVSDNVSGSATGESQTILKVGPEISLSSKSITKDSIGFSGATSTARATFNITLKAVGGDIYFGSQAASSTFNFQTYKGGTATTLFVASSTSWSVPSGTQTSGIVSGGFILQEGNSVTLPVTFIFEGRTTAGALVSTDAYAVGLESVKWNTGGATQVTSNFMSGRTEWRTDSVTMP